MFSGKSGIQNYAKKTGDIFAQFYLPEYVYGAKKNHLQTLAWIFCAQFFLIVCYIVIPEEKRFVVDAFLS